MNEMVLLLWAENLISPATYIGVLTAVLLLFGQDWRMLLPIVLVQYTAVAVVLTESLTLYVAFSKLIVGLFVTLILYVTVRQVYVGGWRAADTGTNQSLTSWPFRLILTIIIVVSGWLLAQQMADELPASYLFMTYSLVGLGLWGFIMTTNPLRIGVGLLLILSGVELFYFSDNQSLIAVSFMGGAHVITAVVISYLTQARSERLTNQTVTVRTDR